MTRRNDAPLVEVDLRGAALDGESRAFAVQLLEAWEAVPPPFSVMLRSPGSLGAPIPESMARHGSKGTAPDAILALWPVWPHRAPSPVALYVGKGSEALHWWNPRVWRARRTAMVLVNSRREKVELQVLRRFRRDRVWSVDAGAPGRCAAEALTWLAEGSDAPPVL
jgi:hypothetical protein